MQFFSKAGMQQISLMNHALKWLTIETPQPFVMQDEDLEYSQKLLPLFLRYLELTKLFASKPDYQSSYFRYR